MVGIAVVFLLISLGIELWGWKEKGPWKYRGIRKVLRAVKKRGGQLPDWLEERVIFRTWILFAAGSTIVIFWGCKELFGDFSQVSCLSRPEYGTGSLQEELVMEWEDRDGKSGKEKVAVMVEEQVLTAKEKEKIFAEVKEKIENMILGENTSADQVDKSLTLPEKIEGCPAEITWVSSDPSSVDWEGKLGKEIPEEGKRVCLTAFIRLRDEEQIYEKDVTVYPPELTWEEQIQELIRQENETENERENETESQKGKVAEEEEGLNLPQMWGDKKLTWKRDSESTRTGAAMLLFLCPILLLLRERQLAKEEKKRERQQMLQDYPEILSKLTLLLGAGMNLRKAMERIGKDYVNYNKRNGKRKAYENILEMCREMNRGIGEREAYERFGERCDLLPYRTFSALLVQHLQKGSKGMENTLEEEAVKAQQMRQQQARVLGEQASTKLLFPMVLMLLVVFIILMVPAWISFGG